MSERWQEQRSQDGDDGNHDQELNQGECQWCMRGGRGVHREQVGRALHAEPTKVLPNTLFELTTRPRRPIPKQEQENKSNQGQPTHQRQAEIK